MDIQDLNTLEPLSVDELNQVVGGRGWRVARRIVRRVINRWSNRGDSPDGGIGAQSETGGVADFILPDNFPDLSGSLE